MFAILMLANLRVTFFEGILVTVNINIAITQFPLQVLILVDECTTGIYNFQTRHLRCV